MRLCGLLRNSTKIAAQFLGLGQCSQKAPAKAHTLKQRPDCHPSGFPAGRVTAFMTFE
jgi:hypothetical protein